MPARWPTTISIVRGTVLDIGLDEVAVEVGSLGMDGAMCGTNSFRPAALLN
jgi:hypothetical protein